MKKEDAVTPEDLKIGTEFINEISALIHKHYPKVNDLSGGPKDMGLATKWMAVTIGVILGSAMIQRGRPTDAMIERLVKGLASNIVDGMEAVDEAIGPLKYAEMASKAVH